MINAAMNVVVKLMPCGDAPFVNFPNYLVILLHWLHVSISYELSGCYGNMRHDNVSITLANVICLRSPIANKYVSLQAVLISQSSKLE